MITRSNSTTAATIERPDVPDGVHRAHILEAFLDHTPTGIEFISLKLEIAGHENARRVYTKLWLSDGKGNTDRLFDAMLSAGHKPSASGELPDPAPGHFEGRDCKVRIGMNKRGFKDVLFWQTPKADIRPPEPAPRSITHDSLAGNGSRPAFKRPAATAYAADGDEIPF